MSNESNEAKNYNEKSSEIVSVKTTSILSEDVLEILENGMRGGLKEDTLSLLFEKIEDSMISELCEWLIKLGDKVKRLSLGQNRITSAGASQLFQRLKETNLAIDCLVLRGNQLDDDCMRQLGEYIKNNKTLQKLYIHDNKISDRGIEMLSGYIDESCALNILNLRGNVDLSNKSIPVLIKMIESSRLGAIETIKTSITQQSSLIIPLAHNVLKYKFNELSLEYMDLNDDAVIKICEFMRRYGIEKLKVLNLSGNPKITSKGASMLFDTLRECHSVVSYLNLYESELDDECLRNFGEYIQDDECLELFYIFNTKVTDNGIQMLPQFLMGNMKLRKLDFSMNSNITDASVPYLIDIVMRSYLNEIGISDTSITDDKRKELKNYFVIPKDQREIPIKSKAKSAAKIQSSTYASV